MAGIDVLTLALSKKYTEDTVQGAGAVAGKPCQIQSIAENTDGSSTVTFLWVDNSGTSHTSTLTVPKGAKGDKGDTGEKGEKGDKGYTGQDGTDGATPSFTIGTVTSGAVASATVTGTDAEPVLNLVLPQGEKGAKGDDGAAGHDGADGKSFEIKAAYTTYADFIAAHPTGEAGEAYFVGGGTSPDLYTWLSDDAEWYNNGPIAGVKGDKGDTGDTGEDGFSPTVTVTKENGVATISVINKTGTSTATVNDGHMGMDGKSAYEVARDNGFEGTQAEWLAELKGEKGDTGAQGLQGLQGDTGRGIESTEIQFANNENHLIINYDDDTTDDAGEIGIYYADMPIGAIAPFGGSTAPNGFLLCQGQAVSRTEYADLFTVIGTAFGEGDSSTTFNVPDLRESVPKGAGLTGHTVENHLDADGLAVGEFIDDRIQRHHHLIYKNYEGSATGGAGSTTTLGGQVWSGGADSRAGDTTEVKAVGVNYIIKAKNTGVPQDFAAYVKKVTSPDWSNAEDVTSAYNSDRTSGYTVVQDGWVSAISYQKNEDATLSVNGVLVWKKSYHAAIDYAGCSAFIPVSTGDIITGTEMNSVKIVPHK